MTGTAEAFENNRYLRVDQLISAETASLCTTYAKADEKHRYNSGDSLTQNSHSKYADFLMESLMVTLCPKIEKITGLSLTPTYSYFRVYKAGEELREHVDRPSCEISCSLCLGYDYLGKDFKWRLNVNGNKIALSPGDGVIYRGMELPHKAPGTHRPSCTISITRVRIHLWLLTDEKNSICLPCVCGESDLFRAVDRM
jgi:hypothetical protein